MNKVAEVAARLDGYKVFRCHKHNGIEEVNQDSDCRGKLTGRFFHLKDSEICLELCERHLFTVLEKKRDAWEEIL